MNFGGDNAGKDLPIIMPEKIPNDICMQGLAIFAPRPYETKNGWLCGCASFYRISATKMY